MHKKYVVKSNLSCSIKTMKVATKTLPIESALSRDVTVLMVYEILLLQ